ncbi:MAG: tetratricopeptide repeat protein [bacterium]|nr:tetratricopeptide repeat protein [bacterium]
MRGTARPVPGRPAPGRRAGSRRLRRGPRRRRGGARRPDGPDAGGRPGQDALRWGARAAGDHPASPDARYWYGRALLASGDLGAARSQWEQGLAVGSEHAGLLEALARLLLEQGEEQPAYGLFTQLVRVTGGTPNVHKTLSRIAQKRALWRQALAHWADALSYGSPPPADLRSAVELGIMAGDTAYAVTIGRETVRRDDSAASWAVLGEAYFAARRYQQAETALRTALERDAGQAASRFHLANTLELLGRQQEADAEFRRYVAGAPQDPIGHFNFALHLESRSRLAEALQEATRACQLGPRVTEARLLKARLLDRLGDDGQLLAELGSMLADGVGNAAKLGAWRDEVKERRRQEAGLLAAGQVLLLHIALPDDEAAALVRGEIADGVDFAALATSYSVGAAAATGGDIGWLDPRQMAEPLRTAVASLSPQEISPPVASGGLVLRGFVQALRFKRLR